MSGPTSLRWRMLRSAAFTAVATQLAAFGHVIGGGGRPDIAILLIGAVTIGAVGTGLTSAQRRWRFLFGVMAASQLAFHLLFTVGAHAGTSPSMAAHPFIPTEAGRMLVFHLIAAACAAAVLAIGDAAIFALFGALRRAVRVPRPHVPADRPLRTAAFGEPHLLRAGGALLSISPRRGPPVASQ